MMDQNDAEQLSAWVDGERVPAREVLLLLERPGALDCVRDCLQVRAALEADVVEASALTVARVGRSIARARWYARIPRVGWAAALLLVSGLVFALSRRAPPVPEEREPGPPRAEFVAPFPTR